MYCPTYSEEGEYTQVDCLIAGANNTHVKCGTVLLMNVVTEWPEITIDIEEQYRRNNLGIECVARVTNWWLGRMASNPAHSLCQIEFKDWWLLQGEWDDYKKAGPNAALTQRVTASVAMDLAPEDLKRHKKASKLIFELFGFKEVHVEPSRKTTNNNTYVPQKHHFIRMKPISESKIREAKAQAQRKKDARKDGGQGSSKDGGKGRGTSGRKDSKDHHKKSGGGSGKKKN